MVDGGVVDGLSFAIGSGIPWKRVSGFETVGEVFADVDGDECF